MSHYSHIGHIDTLHVLKSLSHIHMSLRYVCVMLSTTLRYGSLILPNAYVQVYMPPYYAPLTMPLTVSLLCLNTSVHNSLILPIDVLGILNIQIYSILPVTLVHVSSLYNAPLILAMSFCYISVMLANYWDP